MKTKPLRALLTVSTLLALSACEDNDGEGSLEVRIEAESSITDGIFAGTGDESIVDGWDLVYSKFVVSVGDVRVARSGQSDERVSSEVEVVDLIEAPASGRVVASFTGLSAARWDRLDWSLVVPTASARKDVGVTQADLDAMIAGACTYLIEGTLTPAAGAAAQSNPPGGEARTVPATGIAFSFCVPAPVAFTACEHDEVPGVAVPRSGVASAMLTLHGDHIVFPSFDDGAEIVERRAQWLADADTNGDDVLDRAELEAITGSALVALFPAERGYSLTGSPSGAGAIRTAFDFLTEQLRTQGHFDGHGECTPIVP